ncbi:MAG: glycosyltransferase family 2 protein [Deltaproteobacteria bacterium]|nr:glycosyltransferase family 2 protein [Deltaproteobacteria bacterium]
MNPDSISFVIPAYNEGEKIGQIVHTLRDLYPKSEIIVVDDGSQDDTGKRAKEAGAHVITHPYNIGNGAAVKTGIRRATGEVLVFLDADGQHRPEDVGRLLEYMPRYDMVVGARRSQHRSSWVRSLANKAYNLLASYVTKYRIEDLTSGFRVVKASAVYRFLYLLPNTYSYPSTITIALIRSGRSVKYVPIEATPRRVGSSNIRLVRDGLRFFLIILRICTLFSPLRVFLPVSAALFLTGLSYYGYTFFLYHRFTNMSALLLSTSLLIFMLGLISEQICQMRFERSESSRR